MSTRSLLAHADFNAQHSPMGAFMSFTCGHVGTGGGIGVEIGKPAAQNVFVGVKRGSRMEQTPLRCLPFLKGIAGPSAAANYDVERAAQRAAAERAYLPYALDEVQRDYNWATDKWTTEDFTFTLFSPFGPIPEPGGDPDAIRQALLPAIVARLEVDNRQGTSVKTGVFAIDFGEAGTRLLGLDNPNGSDERIGFAWRRNRGVLAQLENGEPGLAALQRWSVAEGLADINPIHMLGNTAGVVFEVPAGQKRTLLLSIGVYLDGIVTTGLEGKYFYTRYYNSLEDVLSTALDQSDRLIKTSHQLDQELLTSGLSEDQRFMIAHSTRSYYGSTQLLDIGGEPYWIVNEGEYCMMNTLDLVVDQAFWELNLNPWVVRNILDGFTRRFVYHDQVRAPKGKPRPGGISFTHDQGVNNNFSPNGQSSYELARLHGCFSFMTAEELLNWVLTATCYVAKTGDYDWLASNRPVLKACAESIQNRCNNDGLIAFDSVLCQGGSEITTYDSLDESLGQTRNNAYIAVKTWASLLGLRLLNELAGAPGGADTEETAELMDRLTAALIRSADKKGVIPAVMEPESPGFTSRILPIAEALVYPNYWLNCLRARGTDEDCQLRLVESLNSPLVAAVKRHTLALLTDPKRRNLFADGGIRLSSTSNNSWMSKIAIFQHVCRTVLHLQDEMPTFATLMAAADAAHTRWQTEGISKFWACSDQLINGEAKGSRYYPRIVTSALCLDEKKALSVAVATASS